MRVGGGYAQSASPASLEDMLRAANEEVIRLGAELQETRRARDLAEQSSRSMRQRIIELEVRSENPCSTP